jgi:Protein of unknown function (DUF2442)
VPKDIVDVRPAAGYQLHLRFEDGVEGTVDLAKLVGLEGVFAPLRDRAFFEQVRVNSELGTIVWPNGADLDPDVLYAEISGKPIAISPRQTTAR